MTNRTETAALRLSSDFRAICAALRTFGCRPGTGLKIEELCAAANVSETRMRQATKHYTKLGYLTTNAVNGEIVRTAYSEAV